jgi:hypothetical protein
VGGGSRLPDALATFCRAWEERECRTVEVANAAIAACAQQGNWEAAQEVRLQKEPLLGAACMHLCGAQQVWPSRC